MYCRHGNSTRFREGLAHRGNVDWNDLEFVEDGIALDEVNLVPSGHEQERSCSSPLSDAGCKEVPVTVTDDLEIHLLIAENENNNVRFDQLPNQGSSNFTLAMNITNITDARLVMTFPVEQGLRVAEMGFYDDGVLNEALAAPESEFLPDGRLRIIADVDYPLGSYPMVRNLFVDFTTMAPFTNDDPVWTALAPAEGTIIPVGTTNGEMLATEDTGTWVTDESGWSLQCEFTDAGWDVRMDENAALYVTANGASATGQCAGVDAFGAETVEHRNYTFGMVMDASASVPSDGDQIEFTVTPTDLIQSLTVTAHAHQMTTMGSETTAVAQGALTVLSLSMSGLAPGEVMIMGTATANGMLDYNFMLDLGIEKANTPPTITIDTNLQGQEAEWELDGLKFTLNGNVIDPDGQDVSMVLSICNGQTSNFNRDNLAWEIQVSIANCIQNNVESPYNVVIVATDESGASTTLSIDVVDPNAGGTIPVAIQPQPTAKRRRKHPPCSRTPCYADDWIGCSRMGFITPRLTNRLKRSCKARRVEGHVSRYCRPYKPRRWFTSHLQWLFTCSRVHYRSRRRWTLHREGRRCSWFDRIAPCSHCTS